MPLSAASALHDLSSDWQRQLAKFLTDRPTNLTYAVARQLVIAYKNRPPCKPTNDKAIRLSFDPKALRPFVDITAAPDKIQQEILRLLKIALPDAALSDE